MWNAYAFLAIVSGFFGFLGFIFFIFSLRDGSVGVSTAIANSYPVIGVLFGVFILSETLSIEALLAVALILVGVVGVSIKFSLKTFIDQSLRRTNIYFALGAMCLWVVQTIMLKFAGSEIHAFQVIHMISFGSLLSGTLFFFGSGKHLKDLTSARKVDVFVACTLAFMYFGGMFSLNLALQAGTLSITSAIAGAVPFVSAIFAYMFFKERLSGKEWFAILLVVVGLVGLGVFG